MSAGKRTETNFVSMGVSGVVEINESCRQRADSAFSAC